MPAVMLKGIQKDLWVSKMLTVRKKVKLYLFIFVHAARNFCTCLVIFLNKILTCIT